jgi:predicted nuclease of predicted toxin-antitoxin system
MRVLIDECLPRRLGERFPAGSVVKSVQEQGWSGKRNGELLRLAEREFDVFVTMDRGLAYQQNFAGFDVAVILLRAPSNRLPDLLPLLRELKSALLNAQAGQLVRVQVNES